MMRNIKKYLMLITCLLVDVQIMAGDNNSKRRATPGVIKNKNTRDKTVAELNEEAKKFTPEQLKELERQKRDRELLAALKASKNNSTSKHHRPSANHWIKTPTEHEEVVTTYEKQEELTAAYMNNVLQREKDQERLSSEHKKQIEEVRDKRKEHHADRRATLLLKDEKSLCPTTKSRTFGPDRLLLWPDGKVVTGVRTNLPLRKQVDEKKLEVLQAEITKVNTRVTTIIDTYNRNFNVDWEKIKELQASNNTLKKQIKKLEDEKTINDTTLVSGLNEITKVLQPFSDNATSFYASPEMKALRFVQNHRTLVYGGAFLGLLAYDCYKGNNRIPYVQTAFNSAINTTKNWFTQVDKAQLFGYTLFATFGIAGIVCPQKNNANNTHSNASLQQA